MSLETHQEDRILFTLWELRKLCPRTNKQFPTEVKLDSLHQFWFFICVFKEMNNVHMPVSDSSFRY